MKKYVSDSGAVYYTQTSTFNFYIKFNDSLVYK